jgi:cleavage stimulation factor subunit 3
VGLWKRLIEYEKSNPQKADAQVLRKRIEFVYNQCLLCLYHYAEIWYDYANYHSSAGALDAASAVFERAITALPNSLLLHFVYADTLESLKNYQVHSICMTRSDRTQKAQEIYERLLSHNESSLVYIQYMKFTRRTQGFKAARAIFKRARTSPACTYHVFVISGT